MKLLSQLNEEGTTVIMVTHSPYDANYAHRIVNLFDGKVVTENIKEHFHIKNMAARSRRPKDNALVHSW